MRATTILALCLLPAAFAACRGPAHPRELAADDASSVADAGTTSVGESVTSVAVEPPAPVEDAAPPKNDPRCPKSLLAAEGGKCSGEFECAYPQGTCGCNPGPICTGVAPAPQPGPRPGSWGCSPNDPKMVRLDGCPIMFDVPGIPCQQAGAKCVYPSCSWQRRYAVCSGGKWIPTTEQLNAPPP